MILQIVTLLEIILRVSTVQRTGSVVQWSLVYIIIKRPHLKPCIYVLLYPKLNKTDQFDKCETSFELNSLPPVCKKQVKLLACFPT